MTSPKVFRRPGFLTLTLRSGEAPEHVPAQLDVLSGAARAASTVDGGALDRTLRKWGGGGRVSRVYHARAKLGHAGEQHVGFDDVEEALGMSRSYKVELSSAEHTDDVLAALRSLSIVESAAEQQLFVPMRATLAPDTGTKSTHPELWAAHDRIRAREALAMEPGDERVTTAVVDTGVTLGHPELQRKCLAGYDTVDLGLGGVAEGLTLVGDSRGYDFNPRDDVGHGSHVAGIIGAQGWRVPPGVGGRSLVLPLRVLAAVAAGSTRAVGVGAIADINAGMKVAVDLGADVINMSFGTPESSLDREAPLPHRRTVRYATHYGCILVAAAGNSGQRERFYPAAHPEVIAVGSASIDAGGRRSPFSTWGAHVALCAPGERIPGLARRGYQANSGTSFASPFVAGAAALLVARARRHGKTLNGADVKRLLIEGAARLPGGPNEETGAGMLDVLGALRRLDAELTHARAGTSPARDTTEARR